MSWFPVLPPSGVLMSVSSDSSVPSGVLMSVSSDSSVSCGGSSSGSSVSCGEPPSGGSPSGSSCGGRGRRWWRAGWGALAVVVACGAVACSGGGVGFTSVVQPAPDHVEAAAPASARAHTHK